MLFPITIFYASMQLAACAPIPFRSVGQPNPPVVKRSTIFARDTSELFLPPGSGHGRRKDKVMATLFPVSDTITRWTTAPGTDDTVPITDETFNPTHDISGDNKDYTKSPDGRKVLKAHYPEGSFNPSHTPRGGFSFYASGPEGVDLTTAREATFGYAVMFPDGFDFVKGGKLPGFYGGDDDEIATSCSGGRRSTKCFSTRFMWREEGLGELYNYLPSFKANKKQCNMPNSECNPKYGASVGRGSFKFTPGKWTTISQRVKLNDVGASNGEIEVFANGKSVISLRGVKLRKSGKGRIRGMFMQTFFGGSSSEWATPKDQDVFFSDFSVGIVSTFD